MYFNLKIQLIIFKFWLNYVSGVYNLISCTTLKKKKNTFSTIIQYNIIFGLTIKRTRWVKSRNELWTWLVHGDSSFSISPAKPSIKRTTAKM